MNIIRHRSSAAAVLVVVLAIGVPSVGTAQQRSINLQADINKTFDTITKSKADHDAVTIPTRTQLQDLTKKLEGLNKKADSIPPSMPADQRLRREREIDAEILQTTAAYLSGATTLVNEAVKLTATGITSLEELGQRIDGASNGVSIAGSLRARIGNQTEVGRKIAEQARELKEKADKDPSAAKRASSLVATASALDRSITTLKSRLAAEQRGGTADKSRIATIVADVTERWMDSYILLQAEQSLLADLKTETEVAIHMASLNSVEIMVGQSLTPLDPANGEGMIPGLGNAMEIMQNRNRRMFDAPSAGSGAGAGKAATPPISVPKFRNF